MSSRMITNVGAIAGNTRREEFSQIIELGSVLVDLDQLINPGTSGQITAIIVSGAAVTITFASHPFVNGDLVDVFWGAGSTRAAVVSGVTSTTIRIDISGVGELLPVIGTLVQVVVPTIVPTGLGSITGFNIVAASCWSSFPGYVLFKGAGWIGSAILSVGIIGSDSNAQIVIKESDVFGGPYTTILAPADVWDFEGACAPYRFTRTKRYVRGDLVLGGGDHSLNASIVVGNPGYKTSASLGAYRTAVWPDLYVASQNGDPVDFLDSIDESDERGAFKLGTDQGWSWTLGSLTLSPFEAATITGVAFSHGSLVPQSMRATILVR